jgi:imidazolonepropionase-like amidohydrolase
VAAGRIEAAGPRGEVFVPAQARRVSGSGGTLLAGFQDVHVRLDPEFLDSVLDPETTAADLEGWFVENLTGFGFTGIVDTGSPLSEVETLLDRVAYEEVRGPVILGTGGTALAGIRVGGSDASVWTDEVVAELLLAEATLVPALSLLLPPGDASDAELDAALIRLRAAQAQVAAFVGAGGRIAFGSGFGWGTMQDPLLELELLDDAGIGFSAILAALTTEPALRFGQVDRGEVEPGMVADLVLLDGDPRADLSAFERVRWVLRSGVPIYGTVR